VIAQRKKLYRERCGKKSKRKNKEEVDGQLNASGWEYQLRGCCEKLRTGEDGEELFIMRPTLVPMMVEVKKKNYLRMTN